MTSNVRQGIATEGRRLNSSAAMDNSLRRYKKEMVDQLENILSWWMQIIPDEQNGGFYGKIDHNNIIYHEAPKVLYSIAALSGHFHQPII